MKAFALKSRLKYVKLLTGARVYLDPPRQEHYGGDKSKDPQSKYYNCGKYNFFHPTMSPQMGDYILSQLVSDFFDLSLRHVVFPRPEDGCVSIASIAFVFRSRSASFSASLMLLTHFVSFVI